jgi:hypothetical protein
MSNGISDWDKKNIGWKCGNLCAIPECRKQLFIDRTGNDQESIIGEIAHIKGENPTSARYDSNMTPAERNSHQNLIILCRDHHKMIDDQPNTYTVERLLEIKTQHEKYICESTASKVLDVTFEELGVVTKYLVSNQPTTNDTYTVIPPRDKIQRNRLSMVTERLITMGMTQVKQVSSFLNRIPDIEFGERLKQRFVEEYEILKNAEHLTGDELFSGLLEFASKDSPNFIERAAGLAVLVYLFEKCEVFEK